MFDGARYDVFSELLEAGKLPNISRYILANGAFLKGYSTLPTTTGPAHIPFLYGVYAGKAGVPGIRWFDKSKGRRVFATGSGMRSYVGMSAFDMGSDIAETYVPLYDYFSRPTNIFGHLDTNHNVRLKSNRTQKTWYYIHAHTTDDWEVVDFVAGESTKKRLEEGVDFVFTLFPGIDELTHLSYPTHERVLTHHNRLDRFVGELFQDLSSEEASKTLFFIVSDHGLTQTHTHVPLIRMAREAGYTPIYYPRIYGLKYDMAILESGNALASIYFMEPVANRPSLYRELCQVKRHRAFIDSLLEHEGIDFLAYRVGENALGARGRDGELTMDFGEPGYVKLTASRRNPLECSCDAGRIAMDVTLDLTRNTNYPDSIVQLKQIFESRRAGDLIVLPREGFDLRARYEWPEHKSSHGSLVKAHMEVPICTNLPLKATSCRTVDVFPTILDALGRVVPHNIDGRVLR